MFAGKRHISGMRIRKLSALVGAVMIFGGCVVLYLMMDVAPFLPHDFQENSWIHTVDKQTKDENRQDTIREKKHANMGSQNIPALASASLKQNSAQSTQHSMKFSEECDMELTSVPDSTIKLLDVYQLLSFDNPDGGAWKQGWNISYSPDQWNAKSKLKIFVVPHSHNDPGWLKTFEDYYQTQTRNILNNLVKKLLEDHRRKFIWAEISYLSLWWDEINTDKKEKVKKLLDNGQLEIVTGGWVMNDEANTHYFSMLEQMIEGHAWLERQLNYKPKNSWAIDPFGHSPVMPYLLKRMGLENLVIHRTHYSIKKYFARNKYLEFHWRQLWDGAGSTDLFTHMTPFYSYDVPHTCGPDPKVCCQFDFRRLPGYGMACPWRIPPQVINDHNVKIRAEMLLDQYRKKAQLYNTNVLLVPLGDDFRYDRANEWDAQYNNYQKLFDYMNSDPNLHVEAQFGTLSDYFSAVHAEQPPEKFPTLSGDFFTYADRDDHYWSGYYTSRPFFKRMDRELINYLRAAEILYGLAWSSSKEIGRSDWLVASESGFVKLITEARQSLGLFQHHDGITGTAKDHVVEDYGRKMLEAINGLQHVMQQAAHFLLSSSSEISYQPDPEAVYFNLDDRRKQYHSLPRKYTLQFQDGSENEELKRVVLFNSLTWTRQEIVVINVNTPYVKVTTSNGSVIKSQTTPIFMHSLGVSPERLYEVSFIADLSPLSLTTYFVYGVPSDKQSKSNSLSKIKIYNFVGDVRVAPGFENIEKFAKSKGFVLSNSHLKAYFSNNGFLEGLSLDDGVIQPVHIDFARYGAREAKETSGAYLFLPSGAAKPFTEEVPVRVIEGPLFSRVDLIFSTHHHSVRIYNTPGADSLGLEIQNYVDISEQNNFELVMRVTSKISNGDEFFSDLNGLQMIRRKRFNKIPLQANYYPLPSAAFIEDDDLRLTILTSLPIGFASLREGQIEVMQDRRLNQDDNRGLGQGVWDNHPLKTTFRLLLEKREKDCHSQNKNHPSGLLTKHSHLSSLSLLYPIMRFLPVDSQFSNMISHFSPTAKELDHDIHLVKLHTVFKPTIVKGGIIIQRIQMDTCYPVTEVPFSSSSGMVNISDLLPHHFDSTMKQMSLSFMYEGKKTAKGVPQKLCPMEMAAYVFGR